MEQSQSDTAQSVIPVSDICTSRQHANKARGTRVQWQPTSHKHMRQHNTEGQLPCTVQSLQMHVIVKGVCMAFVTPWSTLGLGLHVDRLSSRQHLLHWWHHVLPPKAHSIHSAHRILHVTNNSQHTSSTLRLIWLARPSHQNHVSIVPVTQPASQWLYPSSGRSTDQTTDCSSFLRKPTCPATPTPKT